MYTNHPHKIPYTPKYPSYKTEPRTLHKHPISPGRKRLIALFDQVATNLEQIKELMDAESNPHLHMASNYLSDGTAMLKLARRRYDNVTITEPAHASKSSTKKGKISQVPNSSLPGMGGFKRSTK